MGLLFNKELLLLIIIIIPNKSIERDNNCVKLSDDKRIVNWGGKSTDLLINIQPSYYPPFITYSETLIKEGNVSLLYYEWCGPLMLIIKEFAKSVHAK